MEGKYYYKYKKYKSFYKQQAGSKNNNLRDVFQEQLILANEIEQLELNQKQLDSIFSIFDNAYSQEILGLIPNKKQRALNKIRTFLEEHETSISEASPESISVDDFSSDEDWFNAWVQRGELVEDISKVFNDWQGQLHYIVAQDTSDIAKALVKMKDALDVAREEQDVVKENALGFLVDFTEDFLSRKQASRKSKKGKKSKGEPVVIPDKRARALAKVRGYVDERASLDTRVLGAEPDTFSEDDEPKKKGKRVSRPKGEPVVIPDKRARALAKVRKYIAESEGSLLDPIDHKPDSEYLIESELDSGSDSDTGSSSSSSSSDSGSDSSSSSSSSDSDSSDSESESESEDIPLSKLLVKKQVNCSSCNKHKKFSDKRSCCEQYPECNYTSRKQCHTPE